MYLSQGKPMPSFEVPPLEHSPAGRGLSAGSKPVCSPPLAFLWLVRYGHFVYCSNDRPVAQAFLFALCRWVSYQQLIPIRGFRELYWFVAKK